MQRCMFRMTALVHHVQGGLMALHDRNQGWRCTMALAKVSTEPALSILNMFHRCILLLCLSTETRSLLPTQAGELFLQNTVDHRSFGVKRDPVSPRIRYKCDQLSRT